MRLHIFQLIGGESIWSSLIVIAVLEALAVYLWQFRKSPGALPQIYGLACKAAWLLFQVLAIMSTGLPSKLFWVSLQRMLTYFLPYFWFVFIVQISGQEKKVPRLVNYCLRGMIVFLGIVILSNSWHGWYWQDVWLDGEKLLVVWGPLAWLAMGFGYLLSLTSVALGVRWVLSLAGWRQRQAMAIIVAPCFTVVGYLAEYVPGGHVFSMSALGFLLSGIYIIWTYRRWLVYSMLSQAQEAVVQNMIDGLLVIDEEDYIVDMNEAAKKIFAGLPAVVGGKYREVLTAWPALAEVSGNMEAQTVEAIREYAEERCCYQFNITPYKSAGDYLLGEVIIIRDITQQKHDQTQLMEQQKALSILAERDRLGREVHDGQGQVWSFLQLELQTVRTLLKGAKIEEAVKQVDRLAGIARDLNADVRESIVGLKQPASFGRDFVATMEEYLGWYEKNHGIATRLILPPEPVADLFSYTSEVQLLRIVQEALTNIRKHAKARQVEVIIQRKDNKVMIIIVDDGCGFDRAALTVGKKSYGLQIMEEGLKKREGSFRLNLNEVKEPR